MQNTLDLPCAFYFFTLSGRVNQESVRLHILIFVNEKRNVSVKAAEIWSTKNRWAGARLGFQEGSRCYQKVHFFATPPSHAAEVFRMNECTLSK